MYYKDAASTLQARMQRADRDKTFVLPHEQRREPMQLNEQAPRLLVIDAARKVSSQLEPQHFAFSKFTECESSFGVHLEHYTFRTGGKSVLTRYPRHLHLEE